MTTEIGNKPRDIFRAHPVFGWTLTPGRQVNVRFRPDVIQNIDAHGNRRTPLGRTGAIPRNTLAVYGCSFTYGTGLRDEETYPALLQQEMPDIRVVNKGVGGHGSVQALLRFGADIRKHSMSAAVFGVISDHRYRNFPHPQRMTAHLSPDWYRIGVEHVPHARLNRTGGIDVEFTPIWQPSLLRGNFDVFLPDEHVLDLITLAVFREIRVLAKKHDIPVVFVLLDQLDVRFNTMMTDAFAEAHDISTPHNETYRFLPDDIHPNPLAARCFAERLLPVISSLRL